jgi:hypothetical protein
LIEYPFNALKKLGPTAVGNMNNTSTDVAITKLNRVYKMNANIYQNQIIISKSKARTRCHYSTLYTSDKWKETQRKTVISRTMSTKYSSREIINETTSIAVRNHQFWISIHVNRLMNQFTSRISFIFVEKADYLRKWTYRHLLIILS